jgi:hypothetical protein
MSGDPSDGGGAARTGRERTGARRRDHRQDRRRPVRCPVERCYPY